MPTDPTAPLEVLAPMARAVCKNCAENIETWGDGRWRHVQTQTFACRSRTGAEPHESLVVDDAGEVHWRYDVDD